MCQWSAAGNYKSVSDVHGANRRSGREVSEFVPMSTDCRLVRLANAAGEPGSEVITLPSSDLFTMIVGMGRTARLGGLVQSG